MSPLELLGMVISLLIALGNLIGFWMMYHRYVALARDSALFASEVIGHLAAVDETGEVEDPMGLIASSLDQMSRLSGITRMF